MMPLLLAQTGQENLIMKIGGKPGLCSGRNCDDSELSGGQSDSECQGVQSGDKPGDGRQDHGMTAQAFIHIL